MLSEIAMLPGIIIATLFGLILGSFSTAVTHRELTDKSWASFGKSKDLKTDKQHRSACPQCGHILKTIDLIPLFSWLSTKGKCRYCAKPIGAIYPLIELSAVTLCIITVLHHGLDFYALTIMAIIPFLIALVVVDLKKMLLPNRLILIITAIGLISLLGRTAFTEFTFGDMLFHLISAFVFGALSLFIGWLTTILFKKEALGMGDVKFFACAGLWLGPMLLADFCFLAGLLGVIFGMAWKKLTKQAVFPFGPALIASFFVLLMLDGSFLLQFILK
jgi:prepilin signal peptidase PulO-like enzyme (type II secretory pathway)